jgi:hypothetical protein
MSLQQHGGNGGANGRGVHPPDINKDDVRPGETFQVTKTVRASSVPANPDIVFLADTTVSMRDAIETVKSE